VRRVFSSVEEVDSHPTYDRITSVATFEHIMDLPRVVAQAAMLLKPHGTLRVGIPNEGTLLWWMGTQVTGYEFKRRYGLDYGVLMRYEHVNTANDIEQVLNAFFGSVKCRVFGLCRNLAFYRYLECASPDIEFSKRYCESTTHRAA
jgi:SAM-dependent methyltransferase